MRRTIMFQGYGAKASADLNNWLNKHPESSLVDCQSFECERTIVIVAIVDVPKGTKIYGNESENKTVEE